MQHCEEINLDRQDEHLQDISVDLQRKLPYLGLIFTTQLATQPDITVFSSG